MSGQDACGMDDSTQGRNTTVRTMFVRTVQRAFFVGQLMSILYVRDTGSVVVLYAKIARISEYV